MVYYTEIFKLAFEIMAEKAAELIPTESVVSKVLATALCIRKDKTIKVNV